MNMRRLFHLSFLSRLVHPKSPDVEALLSSGFEVKGGQGEKQEKSLSLQFGDFSAVTPCTVVKTPELEAYLEVPWEVPKLRKKLQSRKKIPAQDFMQGSDSGISMSSQETRDVAPWLQAPMLRRRHELEGGGSTSQALLQQEQGRAGSGTKKEGESRRSLCLTQPSSNSSVAANAEFLVQSYPGPRPASMVSASLGLECRSAAEGGGEGAAEAVKVKGEKEREEEGNGESFQQPPPVGDISDLPFSMPKLARRLGQAPPSSPPLKLLRQPAAFSQSLSLNIAAPPPDSGACSSQPCSPTFPKPLRSRPMSLLQPSSQPGPQLNLTLQSRPGEERKRLLDKFSNFFSPNKVFFLWQEVNPLVALLQPLIPLLLTSCNPHLLLLVGQPLPLQFPPERNPSSSLPPPGAPSTICFVQSTAAEREKPGFG